MAESTYHVTLTNDGSGNYTGTLRRGGTAASGGTTINSTTGGSMDLAVTSKLVGQIGQLALALAIDDRAAGN